MRSTFSILLMGVLALTGTAEAKVKKLKQPNNPPLQITAPGSYILDSNIIVTAVDVAAIEVLARDVTIDLNGFVIRGPVVCAAGTCGPVSTGMGIFSAMENVTVKNGSVAGFRNGIELSGGARVENVYVDSNYGYGILAGAGSIIRNCIAHENGLLGIFAQHAVVQGCVATGNYGQGIFTNTAVISGNLSTANLGSGIVGDYLSLVTGNASLYNSGAGIESFYGNVTNNASTANSGFGLVSLYGGYIGASLNVLEDNNGSTANPQTTGNITQPAANQCGLNLTCP